MMTAEDEEHQNAEQGGGGGVTRRWRGRWRQEQVKIGKSENERLPEVSAFGHRPRVLRPLDNVYNNVIIILIEIGMK